jgi:hypothetical protein
VRPPRLGGNKRVGVFATRSPYRPNAVGLSCVKLDGITHDEKYGTVLEVSGADLMDGTPILDIKPYLPISDCHADAESGFSKEHESDCLDVRISDSLLEKIPFEKRSAVKAVLSHDPRPAYHNDPERVYGFGFAGMEIKFTVCGNLLTVVGVE